jgi:hypothetical protein
VSVPGVVAVDVVASGGTVTAGVGVVAVPVVAELGEPLAGLDSVVAALDGVVAGACPVLATG